LRLATAFKKAVLNSPLTSVDSPVTVLSASATWSILEWYGQDPESPLADRGPPTSLPQQQRPPPSSNNFLRIPQTAHDAASSPTPERGRAPAPAATAGKPEPIMVNLSTPVKGSPLAFSAQPRTIRPLPSIPGSSALETPPSAVYIHRRVRSSSTPRSLPPTPVMMRQPSAASVS